jgi:ABC-type proline/glycine betaine transport system substrate-binding protein
MRLYHGSNVVIESINLAMCRPYKDFGKGFYLTDIEEQAKQMANRVSRIYGGSPVVNTLWHYYFVSMKMKLLILKHY